MDRVGKKRKPAKKKKVLLSIVDPWDVSVASVDGLAGRRGLSIEPLHWTLPRTDHRAISSTSGCVSPRTPWPWYKPPSYSSASTAWLTTNGNGPSSISVSSGGGRAGADVPIKHQQTDATDEAAADNKEKGLAEVAASGRDGPIRRLSDRSVIRSLVEELVRTRYKSTPILQRRRRWHRRPIILPIGSINHSGKSENSVTSEHNFWTKDSTSSEKRINNKEERPIDNTRRLSFSMPTKLDAMENLRIGNEKVKSSGYLTKFE